MKLVVALVLVFYVSASYAQSSCLNSTAALNRTQVWAALNGTDAQKFNDILAVVTRYFGLNVGDYCIGSYYYSQPTGLIDQYAAFFATAIGGNLGGANTNVSGIAYRLQGLTSNPVINSEDFNGLFNALSMVHQSLLVSVQTINEMKTLFSQVINTIIQGYPCDIVQGIAGVIDDFKSAIIYNGTYSKPCPAIATTINYIVPLPVHPLPISVALGSVVCWQWNDSHPHSVNYTGASSLPGYPSYGAGTNLLTNGNSSCLAYGSNLQPCYVDYPATYCYTFSTLGIYPFNCNLHGASMAVTITVVTPSTTPSLSPSPSVASPSSQATNPSPSPKTSGTAGSSASHLKPFAWFF